MNKIFVRFESDALGDNIAWLPYLEQYEQSIGTTIDANCYYPDLFGDVYPSRYFLSKTQMFDEYDTVVSVGITNREVPLQKVATDCLGLSFREIRPRFNFAKLTKTHGNTITFSEFGSNYCKSWNNPYGWKQVIKYIKSLSYTPVSVSKEPTNLSDVVDCTGKDLLSVCNLIYSSSMYIGVSSGLAWLSWVLQTPVIMISGHTLPYFEFQDGNRRISASNDKICVGCYNNNNVSVEWEDGWCPFYKNTVREHECTYSISSSVVISCINDILKKQT